MWVYFNAQGDLTTVLLHGQSIRQGNDFDLYICFGPDEADINTSHVNIQCKIPGATSYISNVGTLVNADSPLIFFHKNSATENTGDFVDGNQYACFHYKIQAFEGVTAKFGEVQTVISAVGVDQTEYQGLLKINVERTYGKDDNSELITRSEYNKLVEMIAGTVTLTQQGFTFATAVDASAKDDDGNVSTATLTVWRSFGVVSVHAYLKESYSQWTLIASLREKNLIMLSKSVIIGSDADGSDAQFKLETSTSTVDGNTYGTLSIYVLGNVAGKFIDFTAPIALTSQSNSSEAIIGSLSSIFLPSSGGTATGDITLANGVNIVLKDGEVFTYNGKHIDIDEPSGSQPNVLAYQRWVDSEIDGKNFITATVAENVYATKTALTSEVATINQSISSCLKTADFASAFNGTAITAADIVTKLGSTPVQQAQNATHANTADTTSTVGQPVNISVNFTSGSAITESVEFNAGSSYYGLLFFTQTTSVLSGSVGASLKIAGESYGTAFTSSSASIALRVEVSYLRSSGKYYVVTEDVATGAKTRTLLTSVPASLVSIASDGSTFETEGGQPTASIAGTLEIVS
jgi:hypothetical protein